MSTADTSGRPPRDGVLVNLLAEQIYARIVSGEYPLGGWLRQARLAEEFDVSRTPIREALRKLESAGVLELVPRRGALVHGPEPREIRDAYLVRAQLEGLAAELAAVRIDDQQLADLRAAEDMFAASGAAFAALPVEERRGTAVRAEWGQANNRFHTIVQRTAGNGRLENTIIDLRRAFPRALTALPLVADTDLIAVKAEEHREIRLALERRDPRASGAAMHAHVLRAGELVAEHHQRASG